MIFVTAIYSYGPDNIIGGRGRDIDCFLPSLINISQLGHSLVLYCEPEKLELYDKILRPWFTDRLWLFGYRLESFKYFNQYIEWKRTFYKNIEINDRNETLCFSKMYWLELTINKNLTKEENYMWIDAGLTHHGIFPEKIGGLELRVNHPIERYYPYNTKNIFNPRLGRNLEKELTTDKLFYCTLPACGDQTSLRGIVESVYGINDRNITKHLVAGIFGGHKNTILKVLPLYESLLKASIDRKVHCFEEHIFNCMYIVSPELYDLREFDLWWFYSPGEVTSYLDKEANSFYKIFTSIHDKE